MSDTQLPRYQVFVQEKEGQPHQDAGSVHASDPELALLNARDVFVRRPGCISLWVVPAEAIYSNTAQQLEEQTMMDQGTGGEGSTLTLYYVFCKAKPAGTQTMIGEVQAAAPEEAMQRAVEKYDRGKAPFAWWVFPAHLVLHSDPQDVESMFAPAHDKPFRLATDYHTLTAMRRIRDHNQ
jgi:ring-1,2-phenylacetyl-CoA epoxidase subunit PaaB